MSRLFLVRHGETEGNASRVIQRPDSPLSARGVGQAERLARRLASEGVAGIVASDLARAAATAEPRRRLTGAPLVFEPLLQERNFGDLRGTPYAALGLDPFAPDYAPPNGETWPLFHARVDRAWARVQELAATIGGSLAVVTHGLVCRSLVARHFVLAGGLTAPERLGEHRADDRGGAGALAGAAAQLRRPPRRYRGRAARRLRRRLTRSAASSPRPARRSVRRRPGWCAACRAAVADRSGARGASSGGCPT